MCVRGVHAFNEQGAGCRAAVQQAGADQCLGSGHVVPEALDEAAPLPHQCPNQLPVPAVVHRQPLRVGEHEGQFHDAWRASFFHPKGGDHDQVQVGLGAPEGEFVFKASTQAPVQPVFQREGLVWQVFEDRLVPVAGGRDVLYFGHYEQQGLGLPVSRGAMGPHALSAGLDGFALFH